MPDPTARPQAPAPGRTLRQVLEGCPFFSRVSWSDYPGHGQRAPRARATGIFNLDSLVGKASQGRTFTARDRAALAKAGANLCYVLEYAFPPDKPLGERSLTAVMIVTMDWSETAQLADDAMLTEIASGVAGDAVLRAVLDAADHCWARTPSR
ncbi:hypothetical protein [Fundidesulfovibrio magnetotacticus]|uniref:hypothetical protein n=1 Tax=Fundidesulfovibrio magnetotacticus TaxID=2730080 RepID=UPI0015669726|nr:hypothetical protein [Fundidesulfovibrio magnetotacticus]